MAGNKAKAKNRLLSIHNKIFGGRPAAGPRQLASAGVELTSQPCRLAVATANKRSWSYKEAVVAGVVVS